MFVFGRKITDIYSYQGRTSEQGGGRRASALIERTGFEQYDTWYEATQRTVTSDMGISSLLPRQGTNQAYGVGDRARRRGGGVWRSVARRSASLVSRELTVVSLVALITHQLSRIFLPNR